ncbi:MAG: hypothetical protein ACRD0C_21735 [Acidimicrobiia bacterium]
MHRLIRRTVRALPAALLAVVAGALVLPTTAPAGDAPAFRHGDFMALNSRGKAPNTSSDPMRQVYEFDLYSLATGEKIGTAVDDIFCSTTTPPPCQVFDAKTTFKLPDGEFTNRAQVSVVFDPQRPGWVLVASLPSSKGIIAGTGAYAGRAGKVILTGVNDATSYPAELGVDDRWVIQFDSK